MIMSLAAWSAWAAEERVALTTVALAVGMCETLLHMYPLSLTTARQSGVKEFVNSVLFRDTVIAVLLSPCIIIINTS